MPISIPMIILIAVLPAVGMMIFIYLQDNHEKEPIGLLLKIFGLGILSAIPAIFLEWLAEKILGLIFGGVGQIAFYALSAFFGVAIIEEFVKFLAAYLVTWRNKHFNYKFDGIVYCLFGSMGFAAIENVMYLLMGSEGTVKGVLSIGIQRGLLAIPAHAMCAIFMGYYYGNAKYLKSYGDRRGCRISLLTGFLIASSLHGFYDFCLFTGRVFFFIIFVVFVVVADTFTIIRIVQARKHNEKMYVAPQYRQYWVGPAADPYQAYGGYEAPTYGGYNYSQQYSSNSQFAPPVVDQKEAYTPQVVSQNTNFQPETVSSSQYNPQYTPQRNAQENTQIGNVTYQQNNVQTGSANYQQDNVQTGSANYQQGNAQTNSANYQQSNTQFGTANNQQDNQGNNLGLQFIAPEDATNNNQNHNPTTPDYGTPAKQITPPPVKNMQLKCPVCSAVNYFSAFYCTSCGASLHQL